MHPLYHAKSSAKKYGGKPEDYLPIHHWFDETKAHLANFRHRALRHHSEGIFLAERIFGVTVKNSEGKEIPTRYIGEQHVQEDCGFIPTVADWLAEIPVKPWMLRVGKKSAEVEEPTCTQCGGTKKSPQRVIGGICGNLWHEIPPHRKVPHGECPVCHHYGEDCTGTETS